MKRTELKRNIGQIHRPKIIERPWLNDEGYYDPTAYLAIRNVERECRDKRGQPRIKINN